MPCKSDCHLHIIHVVKSYFRKQTSLPQDHGSWVFILSPLLIGIFAAKKFNDATIYLVIAALTAFLIRQPIMIAVKAHSGRRSRADLPAARFWILAYAGILFLALLGLVSAGFAYLLYLAIPTVLVFAWHLWLVSRREERRQMGIEIVATGILSLAAPAAFWVGFGQYDSNGWWLWILVWMQSAASIAYAYLRLEQREWASAPNRWIRFRAGWRAYAFTSFNLFSTLCLGLPGVLPRFLFVPYLLQWMETIWGIDHPALGWKPTHIGIRQLIVSTLWTILFIVAWRLQGL
jgi:YwiC-like protein